MKAKWCVFLMAALMLAGCASDQQSPLGTLAPPPAKVTLGTGAGEPLIQAVVVAEVESFATLENVEIKEMARASGGKVVVLKNEASRIQGSVNLPQGTYLVTVYVFAPSPEEDAFSLKIGAGNALRAYPEETGALVPVDGGRHVQAAYGPCNIEIGFFEPNVHLDRIEFKRLQ